MDSFEKQWQRWFPESRDEKSARPMRRGCTTRIVIIVAAVVALFIIFNSVGAGLNSHVSNRYSETQIDKYREMADLLDGWLVVLNSILTIILAVAIANTMLIAVSERQREIGTLKALGFKRKQIRDLFPKFTPARVNLILLLLDVGDRKSAEREALAGLEKLPGNKQFSYLAGVAKKQTHSLSRRHAK